MAGALYLVEKRGPVDGTHFISIDSDRSSDIYYEDIRILRFMTVTARWEKASVMERCALRNSSRNGRQLRLIGKRRKSSQYPSAS